MIRFTVSFLTTLLLAFATGLYLPWWSVAVSAFAVALVLDLKLWQTLLSGFFSIFLMWGLLAWFKSSGNDHILAHRFSSLLLSSDHPGLLILLTAFVGGLAGGLAALTGSLLRLAIKGSFVKEREENAV